MTFPSRPPWQLWVLHLLMLLLNGALLARSLALGVVCGFWGISVLIRWGRKS